MKVKKLEFNPRSLSKKRLGVVMAACNTLKGLSRKPYPYGGGFIRVHVDKQYFDYSPFSHKWIPTSIRELTARGIREKWNPADSLDHFLGVAQSLNEAFPIRAGHCGISESDYSKFSNLVQQEIKMSNFKRIYK